MASLSWHQENQKSRLRWFVDFGPWEHPEKSPLLRSRSALSKWFLASKFKSGVCTSALCIVLPNLFSLIFCSGGSFFSTRVGPRPAPPVLMIFAHTIRLLRPHRERPLIAARLSFLFILIPSRVRSQAHKRRNTQRYSARLYCVCSNTPFAFQPLSWRANFSQKKGISFLPLRDPLFDVLFLAWRDLCAEFSMEKLYMPKTNLPNGAARWSLDG
jgi:hypothetical protein